MRQFINEIKVKVAKENSRDVNFIFTVLAENKEDLIKTVNEGLRQKVAEGELDTQNLKEIKIESTDRRGFFSSFLGDVEGLLKSL